jgi:hypothetical protein
VQIRNRVTFEVRPSGLYRSVDRQRWRRVAGHFNIITLLFDQGQFEVHDSDFRDRDRSGSRNDPDWDAFPRRTPSATTSPC